MKNFVVVDANEQVIRTGFCPDDVAALQNCGDESLTVLITAKHFPLLESIKVVGGVLWENVDGEWFVAPSQPAQQE